MARVVTVKCNICYASGKFLQVGQQFDLEDTTLDAAIVAELEEQLKRGYVEPVYGTTYPSGQVGENNASTQGVEAINDVTDEPTEVPETPEEENQPEEEDSITPDTVIADLASATKNARKGLSKKK